MKRYDYKVIGTGKGVGQQLNGSAPKAGRSSA